MLLIIYLAGLPVFYLLALWIVKRRAQVDKHQSLLNILATILWPAWMLLFLIDMIKQTIRYIRHKLPFLKK